MVNILLPSFRSNRWAHDPNYDVLFFFKFDLKIFIDENSGSNSEDEMKGGFIKIQSYNLVL